MLVTCVASSEIGEKIRCCNCDAFRVSKEATCMFSSAVIYIKLNKYTLRTLFDISSRETLFRWSFLFQCLFYLLSDGRKEPVYFDKITGRIEALCYGLDMNYVDPVSVYTCIFIMMKERGILFHINFSLIYILMNVFLKVKFIITYKIVRLREMRYCIYFLLYFSLTVCDCT